MNDEDNVVSKRRGFLKQALGAGAAVPLSSGIAGGAALASIGIAAAAEPAVPAAPAVPTASPIIGYICFSQDEAAFIETMVNIMCPADEYTPNGVDCGLPIYIDRQLAGDFGQGLKLYMQGPFQQGKPQQGYQLPLSPVQHFKAGVEAANNVCTAKHGTTFDQLDPKDAEAFLKDLAAGKVTDQRLPLDAWFSQLIEPLFMQACYADPIYGGNYNKVFWKMIGYPGLPATNTINMVQYRGKPFPGAKDPKSMADFS